MKIHDWSLDPDRNILHRGAETVRLEPKQAELLKVLHAHAGTILGKEDLIRAVWGDVAVSEEVLTTAIYQLRRALGDDSHAPSYIETVPRRGYRLMPAPQRHARLYATARSLGTMGMLIAGAVIGGLLLERHVTRNAATELHRLGSATLAGGEDLNAAVMMLRRASQLDPDNAGIAGSFALALTLGAERQRDADETYAAVNRALELDSENTDARVARAINYLRKDWDWKGARLDLENAAATRDPLASAWLALVSSLRGEQAATVRLASRIEGPPLAASTASTALLLAGCIDQAEGLAKEALRIDPSNTVLARQVRKVRERRLEREGFVPAPTPSGSGRPTEVARMHLAYGDTDAALTALEAALRQRDEHLLYLRVDRRWDPLRSHPRFQSIVAAVGL